MDPASLGNSEWSEIGQLLTSLWLFVASIVLFATSMLVGHNLIPSFVASGHIPNTLQKARPVLYALSIAFFALAMFFLARAVDDAGVLRRFWADYWI